MSPADFSKYPRDLTGYGRDPPDPRWPGGARIAVQFVVNYEEGGERNILHGDATSEAFLSDVLGATPWPGARHVNVESMYEYGSRAGFWRLWRLFTQRDVPVTVFGVASALARSPEAVAAMREARWEIASHGLKWIDYKDVPEKEERAHLAEAIRVHTQATGERPLGWYTGRTSVNTLKAVLDEGGFVYSCDSYAQDDVDRTALPPGRAAGTRGCAHAFSRLCRGARAGVARDEARHRAALAPRASLARRCRPDDPVARHDENGARKPERGGRRRPHGRAG